MAFETADVAWPGWEVVGKLGEGSFGGVYEIQRTLPDGTVEHAALKKLTIPKDPAEIAELYGQCYDSASITAHFKEQMQDLVREYSFMRKFGNNPYVVHCQDLRAVQHKDSIGWDIYIRMELLKPLKAWLNNRYDEDMVIRLGLNICDALSDCHQKNIIHRDIKPENILVSEEGYFKLTDFGIAKFSERTTTGTLTGTYSYMAPEIANRKHYGTSVDIYSLGIVMYWMINDRVLPFLPLGKKIPSGIQRQEAQDRRFSGEAIPEPVNGSPELKRIVLKACAFLPEDRYHSIQELAEDLDSLCYPSVRRMAGRNTAQARKNTDSEDQDEETVVSRPSKPEPPKSAQEKPESLKSERAKPKQKPKWTLLKWLAFAAALGLVIKLGMAIGTRDIKVADQPARLDVTQTMPTEGSVPVETAAKQTAFDTPDAAETQKASDSFFTYAQNDTGLTITGCENQSLKECVIPSEFNGISVTGIGNHAFSNCANLSSITIPDSVTSIGMSAFSGCTSLSSITIPDGVTTIGNLAFLKCKSLDSITISNSVTSIGEYAFSGCTSLYSITIPNSITIIGNGTFRNCSNLSCITIPNSVSSIGREAFYNCTSLSSITIPDGVTSIRDRTFYGCTSLSSITIPDSVTFIENESFYGCTSLSSISLPTSVTHIGLSAFWNCTSLSSITTSRSCSQMQNAFPPTCQVHSY